MYDDSDVAAKKAAGVGGILAIAVAVGPLLGKACIGDRKQHLFMPFYVAAGLQAFGFLLVTFVIPRASGQNADAGATRSVELEEEELKDRFKKKGYVKAVALLWAARVMDRIG